MTALGKYLGWIKSKMIYEWFPFKARRKMKFYRSIIRPGMLCYDVGAHLGDRSDTFLSLGANVIAIEPQPRFTSYLQNKFDGQSNITIVNCAIGDQMGEADLAISNRHPTLTTLSNQAWQTQMSDASGFAIEFDERITVAVRTLDDLSQEYGRADFVKIDVEGFELQVLKGLTYQPQVLSFEFLSFDLDRLKECLAHLENMGYQSFNWSYKETFTWYSDQWASSSEILSQISAFDNGVFSGDVYTKI